MTTKKRPSGRDSRTDPNPLGSEAVTNYRVDRVFAPQPRAQASQVASQLLERTRPRQTTSSPIAEPEEELSLRRALSRLQRQLAEAQRELANKDDEIAAEAERRLESTRANELLQEELREYKAQLDELTAYEARTRGVEKRLQDSIAAADELAQAIEKEHARTSAAEARVDELTRAFDETRALWTSERSLLEERAKSEIEASETKRKAQTSASDEALTTATTRLREQHEAELTELRASHERSLTTLRGELEPKALSAHSLAEDRERLMHEVAALKNEVVRSVAERDELRMREVAQAAEAHAAREEASARAHSAELARVTREKDEQLIAAQQEARLAEGKLKTSEDAGDLLREGLKRAQREAAEARERCTTLEADKHTLEDRLIGVGEKVDGLLEELRELRESLTASEAEVRRAAEDRMRFVAYLEEGLALVGALPASEPEPDAS